MNPQIKAREFWLFKNGVGCANPDYQSLKPDALVIDDFIHVIEYSAYQSLQQKVSELEVKLKFGHLPKGRDTGHPFKLIRKQMSLRYGQLYYDNGVGHETYFVCAEEVEPILQKVAELEAENKRLADEARLLRFHITKELPNSKEIYECIAKALKGEEK